MYNILKILLIVYLWKNLANFCGKDHFTNVHLSWGPVNIPTSLQKKYSINFMHLAY